MALLPTYNLSNSKGVAVPYLSETFKALLKEAQFTNEMLGSGATQIRNANYASKGVYFQAFTSLSTGLERIGKLCLMIDHYIENKKQFPDSKYMKNEIGHNITEIYKRSEAIIPKYSLSMTFLQNLNQPIHQEILSVLSEFALGDRYSNIDLLVGGKNQKDPIAAWSTRIDEPLYESRVAQRKKDQIKRNAAAIDSSFGASMFVLHTSETGDEIRDAERASYMTGVYEAVAPYRQLYVVQVIRYWVEILGALQYKAMECGGEDIPHFSEIFTIFYNDDAYLKTRKSFNKLWR